MSVGDWKGYTMKFTGRGRLIAGVGLAGAVVVATAVVGLPAQAAEGQIRLANTENSVAGSYIVVLKDTGARIASVSAEATSLAGEYGADVSRTYTTALHGFSMRATEAEAKKLAADGSVAYVEQSQKFTISDTQDSPPSWGLDRIDQHDLPLDNAY